MSPNHATFLLGFLFLDLITVREMLFADRPPDKNPQDSKSPAFGSLHLVAMAAEKESCLFLSEWEAARRENHAVRRKYTEGHLSCNRFGLGLAGEITTS